MCRATFILGAFYLCAAALIVQAEPYVRPLPPVDDGGPVRQPPRAAPWPGHGEQAFPEAGPEPGPSSRGRYFRPEISSPESASEEVSFAVGEACRIATDDLPPEFSGLALPLFQLYLDCKKTGRVSTVLKVLTRLGKQRTAQVKCDYFKGGAPQALVQRFEQAARTQDDCLQGRSAEKSKPKRSDCDEERKKAIARQNCWHALGCEVASVLRTGSSQLEKVKGEWLFPKVKSIANCKGNERLPCLHGLARGSLRNLWDTVYAYYPVPVDVLKTYLGLRNEVNELGIRKALQNQVERSGGKIPDDVMGIMLAFARKDGQRVDELARAWQPDVAPRSQLVISPAEERVRQVHEMARMMDDSALGRYLANPDAFWKGLGDVVGALMWNVAIEQFGCGDTGEASCTRPLPSWECADCEQRLRVFCEMASYTGTELLKQIVIAALSGGTINVADAGKLGLKWVMGKLRAAERDAWWRSVGPRLSALRDGLAPSAAIRELREFPKSLSRKVFGRVARDLFVSGRGSVESLVLPEEALAEFERIDRFRQFVVPNDDRTSIRRPPASWYR